MELKIPKKLHYVWVGGGKMSELMQSCMASWEKFCPDYEIVKWSEENFDIDGHPLVKKAMEQKNWSLVSDFIRAWVLYEHGGIYLDTDVEILKPLDEFLTNDFFMGYESKHWVNTAIIGSVKGHDILKKCKDWYISSESRTINCDTNLFAVHLYSAIIQNDYGIKPNGKTTVYDCGIGLYSKDYFYPQDYLTHKIKLTDDSHAIHRCSATWHSKSQRRKIKFFRIARKVIPSPVFHLFEGMVAKKYRKKLYKDFSRLNQNNTPVK